MKATHVQPPNMKDRARDCRERERRKVEMREAAMELVHPTNSDDGLFYLIIDGVDYYI